MSLGAGAFPYKSRFFSSADCRGAYWLPDLFGQETFFGRRRDARMQSERKLEGASKNVESFYTAQPEPAP